MAQSNDDIQRQLEIDLAKMLITDKVHYRAAPEVDRSGTEEIKQPKKWEKDKKGRRKKEY